MQSTLGEVEDKPRVSFDPKLGLCKVKKGKWGIPNSWTVSLPFPAEGSGICSSLCLLDPHYHLVDICIQEAKKAEGGGLARCGRRAVAERDAGWRLRTQRRFAAGHPGGHLDGRPPGR